MSLTNPEKVVTEQRLNEYHQTILPYLGGMPDIMANKFNKSDLYSTDETMIGRWIDGKPLYQKTLSIDITPSSSSRTWYDLSDLTSLSIDTFVTVFGRWLDETTSKSYNFSDSQSPSTVAYNGTQKKLVMVSTGTQARMRGFITLQYTKTSDSPVAIGSDTDYSTTEKIVGTWIDGKPLYQKTCLTSSASQPTAGWTNVPGWSESIANLDTLIKVDFSGCSYGSRIDYKLSGTTLLFYEFGAIAEAIPAGSAMTINYTKTTD